MHDPLLVLLHETIASVILWDREVTVIVRLRRINKKSQTATLALALEVPPEAAWVARGRAPE